MISIGVFGSAIVDNTIGIDAVIALPNINLIKISNNTFLLTTEYSAGSGVITRARIIDTSNDKIVVGSYHDLFDVSIKSLCRISDTVAMAATYKNSSSSFSVYRINLTDFSTDSVNIGSGISVHSVTLIKLSDTLAALFYVDNTTTNIAKLTSIVISGSLSLGGITTVFNSVTGAMSIARVSDTFALIALRGVSSADYSTAKLIEFSGGIILASSTTNIAYNPYTGISFAKLIEDSETKASLVNNNYNSGTSEAFTEVKNLNISTPLSLTSTITVGDSLTIENVPQYAESFSTGIKLLYESPVVFASVDNNSALPVLENTSNLESPWTITRFAEISSTSMLVAGLYNNTCFLNIVYF